MRLGEGVRRLTMHAHRLCVSAERRVIQEDACVDKCERGQVRALRSLDLERREIGGCGRGRPADFPHARVKPPTASGSCPPPCKQKRPAHFDFVAGNHDFGERLAQFRLFAQVFLEHTFDRLCWIPFLHQAVKRNDITPERVENLFAVRFVEGHHLAGVVPGSVSLVFVGYG
jgi:hypothetical protein